MTVHFVHLLDELRRRSLRMADLVADMVDEACEAVVRADAALARRVAARDGDVDRDEVEVESEVIRLLALYQPVGSDLRLLCAILKVNNDLERVADCAVNIAERAQHLDSETVRLPEGEIMKLGPAVRDMLARAIKAYATEDAELARELMQADDAVDAYYGQLVRGLILEAAGDPRRAAAHWDLISVAKNLERIADHATNIAEDVIFLSTGDIVRHQPIE